MRGATTFTLPLVMAATLSTACGAARAGAPDAPVPASEPRALLRLVVDLDRAPDCEEAFDLALYKSRGVDLVSWDDRAGRCTGRVVVVRYLPRAMTADDVLRAAQKAASKVTAAPEPAGEKR
jgi:hypothetical protein